MMDLFTTLEVYFTFETRRFEGDEEEFSFVYEGVILTKVMEFYPQAYIDQPIFDKTQIVQHANALSIEGVVDQHKCEFNLIDGKQKLNFKLFQDQRLEGHANPRWFWFKLYSQL